MINIQYIGWESNARPSVYEPCIFIIEPSHGIQKELIEDAIRGEEAGFKS